MNKRRGVFLLLAAAILAAAGFFAIVFFRGRSAGSGSPAAAWSEEDRIEQDGVILFADRNRFLVGERGTMELTVLCRQDVTGAVTITDDRGQELAVIDADGSGMGKASVEIYETEPRYGQLTASAGEETSAPLSFHVVPEITEEMANRLLEVSADLGDYVGEAGFEDPFGEAALKEIAAWLGADPRVSGVKSAGDGLLFATEDGLMGSYGLGRVSPNAFGYVEPEEAFEAFQNGTSTENVYLSSQIPISNSEFLHLSPIPQNEGVVRFGKYFRASEEKLAARVGAHLNLSEGVDAVKRMASGDFTDYGFVVLNTHGEAIPREDGGNMLLLFMGEATGKKVKEILEPLKSAGGSYNEMWGILDEDQSLQWILDVTPEQERQRYTLLMSSNYLETALADRTFDNTVLYFIVCFAASDREMVDLLHRHGASVFLGCPQSFDAGLSVAFLEQMADVMGKNGESYAFGTMVDVFRPISGAIDQWIQTEVYSEPQDCEDYREAKTKRPVQLSALNESAWRVFYGEGAITGKVLMENGEPANLAKVVVYRWLDHKFQEVWSGESGSDGSFHARKLPYGIYGIAAEKDGESGFVTAVLDDGSEPLKTADIEMKAMGAENNGGNVVGYRGNVYYWKYSDKSVYSQGLFGFFNYDENQSNQLICRAEDGSERVLLTAQGNGPIFISGERIYLNYDSGKLFSVNLDGKDRVEHGRFRPWAADEKNGTLIGKTDYMGEGSVAVLNADHTMRTVFNNGYTFFHGVFDGYCYFTVSDYEGLPEFALFRISLDGSEWKELDRLTKQPEETWGMGLDICQLTKLGEALYYSYGYYAGTGGAFGGGGINCVNLDGSDGKVCVEYGDLTAEEFMVEEQDGQTFLYYSNNPNAPGSYVGYWEDYPHNGCFVKNLSSGATEKSSFQLSSPGSFVCIGGDILLAGDNTTVYREAIPKEAGFGFADMPSGEQDALVLISRLDVVGDDLYVTVDWSSRDPECDLGWRPGYVRNRSTFYIMKLGGKDMKELYSF